MNEVNIIPTYKVIGKERDLYRGNVTIELVNLANDFDVIKIEVSKEVNDVVNYGSEYSIATIIRRTWYTFWLGKKKEYHVLGNMNDEGKVMITTETINNLKKGWKKELLQ